jgi:hypothetical protein
VPDQWQSTADHAPAATAAAATDDDIIRSYGYDPATVKQSHFYVPGHLVSVATDTKPGFGGKYAAGMSEGLYQIPAGLFQLAVHGANQFGLASDADVQYNDLIEKVHNAAYQTKTGGDPSWLAEIAGAALVPVPGSTAKTLTGAVLKGGLTGAAASAAHTVDVQGPGGDYWTPKAVQIGVGAGLGGATGGLAGGIARAIKSRGAELPDEIATRTEQEAQNRVASLDKTIDQTGFAGYADVERAANAGDRAAQALKTQMDNAQTPAQILQASLGLRNWQTGQIATKLYGDVDKAFARRPDLPDVPLTRTEAMIQQAIDAEQKTKDPDTALLKMLENWRDNIGAGASDALVDNSYPGIRRFRSDIGDRISEMRTGAGKQLLGGRAAATLQGVRNAVDDDLRAFTGEFKAPELQAAADAADAYYARERVPFTASDIAKAGAPNPAGTTTDAEADQIFQKFIKAGGGDKAQRFYDRLDPRGRAAVQYQIAADALHKATDPVTSEFSPDKFFGQLDKVKDAYGVFFTGPAKASMDGLKNLAQQAVLSERAENALKTKLNTAAAGGILASGELYRAGAPTALTAPVAAATSLATIARGLMMTEAGRRMLASGADLKPGSPQMVFLYNQIMKQIPAAAARGGTPLVSGILTPPQ